MTAINGMGPVNKLLNFGCCIGMPDCNGVSLVNRFVVKPIDWMSASDGTHKISQFIWRELIARIWAVTTPAFAALTVLYHTGTILAKLPFACLKAAGIKQIPETFSYRAIRDNLYNMGQAVVLTAAGIAAIARPDKLAEYAYPISEKNKVPIFGYHEVSNHIDDPWTVSIETFRSHLQHLNDRNYELCTLEEFGNGYKPGKGKKLAVITFDDSHESQYRTIGHETDPECALGIMEEFKKSHPDFRCTATFFVNTAPEPGTSGSKKHQLFEMNPDQVKYKKAKLINLRYKGYEVAAHGHLHQRFDKMTTDQVEQDLNSFDHTISEHRFNNQNIRSFAWPHGLSPKGAARKVITDRFNNVADFGFHAGKEDPARMDRQRIRRLYVGPNTGFKQYAP